MGPMMGGRGATVRPARVAAAGPAGAPLGTGRCSAAGNDAATAGNDAHGRVPVVVARPPRFADFQEWTCARCGHEELGKPVFLSVAGSVRAYGAGCASKIMYGDLADRSDAARVRRVADEVQMQADVAEAARQEIMGVWRAAVAAFAADRDGDLALCRARRVFHAVKPGVLFPVWLEWVAETGRFEMEDN